jgi:hypothetical protein
MDEHIYKYVYKSNYSHIDRKNREERVIQTEKNIKHEKAEERRTTVEIDRGMKT